MPRKHPRPAAKKSAARRKAGPAAPDRRYQAVQPCMSGVELAALAALLAAPRALSPRPADEEGAHLPTCECPECWQAMEAGGPKG